ncbi:hypothetical protein ABEB36_007352 [Hypothenemus hampei]|uniref:Uncharacterized protein n=1 Tax=Hypothenemus hampei TaxID=57062 RepID=A0ABD1EUJ2_HYPHA
MEGNPVLKKVLNFQSEKDWKAILSLNEDSNNFDALKLLWAWPSESNLVFLKYILLSHKMAGITSLGCGCGLLEWIIQTYTGLSVIGVEINEQWWKSKYSITPFIPLKYAEKEAFACTSENYALLFCYFNNGNAFREYVRLYSGRMIIIIGPSEGAGRHSDPSPFNPDFGCENWHLGPNQEIKETNDFIAVYFKR